MSGIERLGEAFAPTSWAVGIGVAPTTGGLVGSGLGLDEVSLATPGPAALGAHAGEVATPGGSEGKPVGAFAWPALVTRQRR